MKFWIVTPSYNQLDWLKLCIASVADQATECNKVDGCLWRVDEASQATQQHGNVTTQHAISVHHHIQDAQSTDGTPEWLAEYVARQPSTGNYQLTFASEADEGMYDAINKGWKLAPDDTDVIAHLNCDEQYLPNALQTIAEFFAAHQKADVVLADMIVVKADGSYICHRRSLQPFAVTSRFCCGGSTATTFQRAAVTKEKGAFFDTNWGNFGDKVWYNLLHKVGCRFAVCNKLVSVFADTGENLNWTEAGLQEKRRYELEFLSGRVWISKLISCMNGLRRYVKEFRLQSPSAYSLFCKVDAPREVFPVKCPRGNWNKRWKS